MIPAELATAIEAELEGRRPAALAQASAVLSQRYRQPRGGRSLRSEADVSAYLAYRLPATYAATAAALRASAVLQPGFAPSSLLDAGSGPGTAAWAAVTTWPSLSECMLLERHRGMADAGQRLARHASHPALHSATWEQRDLTAGLPFPAADVVIAAYVLGELEQGQQAKLVRGLWDACRGTLILVEPGTPTGFAAVQAARLALLTEGARTVAPCPHDLCCPLLASESDRRWCHFRERLERTRTHRLAKQAERGYEDEPYAYVALSREPSRPISARVVGAPRIGHGHVELDLCTPDGVSTEVVGRRDGESYRRARRLHWGTAIALPEEEER